MELNENILRALGAPFPEGEVEFLPRAASNGKALALAYIDARCVMRRLDAVVGPANWSFDFDLLDNSGKMVRGKLTVCGVTKCDAGEGDKEEETLKSAVSDALKRAAVHFNIGRYLYYLPAVWAPFDPQKRRFTEAPRIDRRAVEEALRICGVTGSPASSPPASPPPQSRPPQAQTPRPESNGDRVATRVAEAVRGGERETFPGAVLPQNPAPRPQEDLQMASAAPAGDAILCTAANCGRPLTKGQAEVSIRGFGQPLCPGCQKQFRTGNAQAQGA